MTQSFNEEKVTRKYDILRKKEEEENTALFAQKFGLPYADISTFPIDIDAIKIIPEESAKAAFMAAFQATGKHLKIALRNPEKEETKALLASLQAANYICELYVVSEHSLERTWSFYKKIPKENEIRTGVRVEEEKLQSILEEIKNLGELKTRIEEAFGGATSSILELILAGALALNTSDVHIEPQPDQVRLRFRLDGVLHDVAFLPKKVYSLLLSRIKLISELKLNIHDRAQDGRFTIHTSIGDVEVRTSILPGPDGENSVMRILNPKAIEITFAQLGMHPAVEKIMDAELSRPNGMILTTGPTGSGKTTALYAFLKKIHSPEIKIITLEDPIEYHLKGIEQSQVDTEKGYTFAEGLRAIVRQDPDVILVGEIRDYETAETAVNAALTGHLVFSTLHTNNAAGAIPRFINLGVKPASIAPALNVTMAQRLVRKICSQCRTPLVLDAEWKKKIEEEISSFPKTFPIPEESQWTIFKASEKGCEKCNGTGYKGRIGVFEIILVTPEIEKLVLQSPSEYEIQQEAARQGHITMRQDGVLKILQGVTDFPEIERVIGK